MELIRARLISPHSPRFPFSHALAWEKVPEGRMRARAKRGSCRLHHRRAGRAGPHPALRATFSRARAREKGKCEANLARMTPTPDPSPQGGGNLSESPQRGSVTCDSG